MKNKIFLLTATLLLFIGLSLVSSPRAHAFSFGNIFNDIKNIFSPQSQDQNPSLTLTSKISLAPGGDYNQNGKITSGDIVRFTYTVLNTTDSSYTGTSLKTNLDTKIINGISNVQGAAGLEEDHNTVVFPNINIDKDQVRTISFDAQINFNKDSDETISIQPELIDQDGNELVSDTKHSETVSKMDEAIFNKFVHITK